MFELVIKACALTLSASSCSEYASGAGATELQCQAGSIMALAEWAGNHPSLRIESWRCRDMRMGKA